MRNFDEISAGYLKEKYGPFQGTLHKNHSNKVGVCELCNEELGDWVTLSSKETDATLVCCLGKCLSFMIGDDKAKALLLKAATVTQGFAPLKTKGTDSDVKEVVGKARNYRKAGFGKGWHSISSIIDWYDRKGGLTVNQIATLNKYNHACSREAGD